MPWSLLISAAALILTIITAVWKLSSVITRNTSAVENLSEKMTDFSKTNEKEHAEFDKTLEDHSHQLWDHEKRITLIEHDTK